MSSNLTDLKQIVLPEGIVTLKTDGIVYVKYAVDTTVDLDVQARMLDAFIEITEKNLRPFYLKLKMALQLPKKPAIMPLLWRNQLHAKLLLFWFKILLMP